MLRLVIPTFYQQVRQNTGYQALRGIFFKRHHPVHRFQRAEHNHALLERVHRTRFALQAFRRCIAVNRHNQAIAQLARVRQIRNVARVQNVEHAVGHHHFFTTLARGGNGHLQLVFGHDAKTGIRTTAHRVFQLDWRNG